MTGPVVPHTVCIRERLESRTYFNGGAESNKWERNVKPLMGDRTAKIADIVKKLPDTKVNRDTVIMLASDGQGLSAAASTSGWAYKYPGRVGDSPSPAPGIMSIAGSAAPAVTHTGEMSMRAGTARYVVAQLEQGKSPGGCACSLPGLEELAGRGTSDFGHSRYQL